MTAAAVMEEHGWPRGVFRWRQAGRECFSVPFTWLLPGVRQALLTRSLFGGLGPRVGGPAVNLLPGYLADVVVPEDLGGEIAGVMQLLNPAATMTSRGCVRRCGFCAVPVTEGRLVELDDWPAGRIICDNNLLACSRGHFNRVIDRLRGVARVDFNQGLDARLLTAYHARRLAELDCLVRLAWDHVDNERDVLRAVTLLRQAGIPRRRMRCYVLIGYHDTPAEALYRLETLRFALGIDPNPMRYVPLGSLVRDYVEPPWTDAELRRYMRYWSHLQATGGVPFAEFVG